MTVLLAYPPPGMGVPLTFSFKEGSKIGLKFSKCTPITLAVVKIASRNMSLGEMIKQVKLLGGTALSKFGSSKNVQNSV